MKRIIMLVLCICLFSSPVLAEDPEDKQPTKDGEMIRCVFTGGSWANGVCTKPAVRTRTSEEAAMCNPLICMITHHGRCVNGVCVKQDTPATPVTTHKH
jgi:hypothetical protein